MLSPRVTLVVSPFENLSGPEAAIYAGGISDEMLNQLVRFRELKLVSGEAKKALQLKSNGVSYFLEGGVRVAGKRLRVSTRLLAGGTKEVVWSSTYERDLRGSQKFDIETDIANKVAAAVAQPYGAIFTPVSQDASARIPSGAQGYWCVLRFYHIETSQPPTSIGKRETA